MLLLHHFRGIFHSVISIYSTQRYVRVSFVHITAPWCCLALSITEFCNQGLDVFISMNTNLVLGILIEYSGDGSCERQYTFLSCIPSSPNFLCCCSIYCLIILFYPRLVLTGEADSTIRMELDISRQREQEALFDMLLGIAIIIELCIFVALLHKNTSKILVAPLERIFKTIQKNASQIVAALDTEEDEVTSLKTKATMLCAIFCQTVKLASKYKRSHLPYALYVVHVDCLSQCRTPILRKLTPSKQPSIK